MKYKQLFNNLIKEEKELGFDYGGIDFLFKEVVSNYHFIKDEEVTKIHKKEISRISKKYLYKKIPIKYIFGYTFFYNFKLLVGKKVLIPREETQLIIDIVKEKVLNKEYKILDLGTGSGAISIGLKSVLPQCEIKGFDISSKALNYAKLNAKIHNLDISFKKSNMFENINEKFDILISNPPYIKLNEYISKTVNKEPKLALYGGVDGLKYYKLIHENCRRVLNNKYFVILELSSTIYKEVINIFKDFKGEMSIKKDYNNKERFIIIDNL